jgi:zinc transport system ATP-binding protein
MAVEPLIEIRDLSVRLHENCILDDIDMNVYPGELHAIIGPNGAGKTTLIRSLLGSMPHSGSISFRFCDKGVIGYVPQHLQFDHAAPITVRDFLLLMLRTSALPLGSAKKIRQRVVELLSLTQVEHLAGRRLGSLSGGELQRVLLAQALYPQPELLLLDEPVSHVDEKGARQFVQLLDRLCWQDGITILMVSHHLASTLRIADTISVINRALVFSGKPREFASSEACYRLFGYREERFSGSGPDRSSPIPITVCKGS